MPVQDNEQPKKTDNFFENNDEQRKTAINQQASNITKSQKLLPFLNTKAEIHQNQIQSLDMKIARREDKISRNEARIERLTAKADRLEDRNTILKNMLGSVPLVRRLIEKNEQKIANIRENKIPKRQDKIIIHKQKLAVLGKKRSVTEHKLNRVIALNDAIKSFSIGLNSERREIFSDAMNRLNTANADCLTDKITALQTKKQQIIEKYNRPETSVVDKVNLNQKLKSIDNKIHDTNEKMQKLIHSENNYSEKSADTIDATMKVTSDKFADISESATYTIPEITENIISAADSVELMDKNKIAEIAADFNSLDGNSKSDLENMQKKLSETLSAMKEIAGNRYMMQSVRESTAKEIPQIEAQLDAVNKALEKFAPAVEDKAKINPDFYKSLPQNERHIESMSQRQADKVIAGLTAVGIAFSAVNRDSEKTAITVAKSDVPVLKSTMQNAQKAMEEESKQAWHSLGDAFVEAYEETHVSENIEVKKPEFKTINPDFYKSLTKDNRSISVEIKANADKIMEQLSAKNIQFSAVERKNDTVAITVKKTDEATYKGISDSVKNERAKQLINPEFFKALPEEERATQRMSQAQAEQKISELSAKNIPHSAVLNGDKSAVTVEKKNVGAAFVNRDKLKRSAQRISGRSRQQDRPKTPDKNQGLE